MYKGIAELGLSEILPKSSALGDNINKGISQRSEGHELRKRRKAFTGRVDWRLEDPDRDLHARTIASSGTVTEACVREKGAREASVNASLHPISISED